jgi:hypothetical protein
MCVENATTQYSFREEIGSMTFLNRFVFNSIVPETAGIVVSSYLDGQMTVSKMSETKSIMPLAAGAEYSLTADLLNST